MRARTGRRRRLYDGPVTALHLVSALAAAAGLALAVDGLGARLGGGDAGARWIRGWTLLWWTVALAATAAGPLAGVVAGSGLALAGLVAGALRHAPGPRSLLPPLAALLAGAPLWLAPPFFYDALVYHLGLPWTWLVNGSFAPVPHHVFSHFPLAASAVYLLPVGWGVPEAAAGLHWMGLVVAMAASRRLARRLGAGRLAWIAPATLAGVWHLVWIATHAAADALVLAALVVALDALAESPEPRWADLAFACGLAAATKYPAVVPTAAVLIGGALAVRRAWGRWLATAAGAVALASFVPVRNLALTGNPVYPLLWPMLGGAGWTARDDARWSALVHEGVDGAASLVTGLWRLLAPGNGLGWAAIAAVPLAVVAVLAARRGSPARRIAVVAGLMLVAWLVTSQTVRYAFPLAAALAVLAAAGAARLPRTARTTATALVALAVAAGVWQLAAMELGTLQKHRLWTGDREAWRAAVVVNDPLPAYRAAAALGPEARLLVVGEGRSWGCPLPHHVSSPYDLQLVQEIVEAAPDDDAVAGALAAAGWTHLLVNRGELARLGGPDFQVLRWRSEADAERWRRFVGRWTAPVWQDGTCSLLRFHHAAAPPADPGGRLEREPDAGRSAGPDSAHPRPLGDPGAGGGRRLGGPDVRGR